MDVTEYQRNALITESHSDFSEYVDLTELHQVFEDFLAVVRRMDKIKKQIFYGRDLPPEDKLKFMSIAHLNLNKNELRILHAALGVGTESGEVIEVVRDGLRLIAEGQEKMPNGIARFGTVKLHEEFGGIAWYLPLAMDALNSDIDRLFDFNIAQLRKRFADKFTEAEANHRDYAAERAEMMAVTGEQYVAGSNGTTADDEAERERRIIGEFNGE